MRYDYIFVHDAVLVWWKDLDGSEYSFWLDDSARDEFSRTLDWQDRHLQDILQQYADRAHSAASD